MNKISKKIVSLITMAAFVLTLVPAAAFAAPVKDSTYTVSDSTAAAYNKTTVNITLSDKDKTDYAGGNILVWAEKDGQVVNDVTYAGAEEVEKYKDGYLGAFVGNLTNQTVDLTFATAGEYQIYVALNTGATSIAQAKEHLIIDGGVSFTTKHADVDYSGFGVVTNGVVDETAEVALGDSLDLAFVVNYGFNKGTTDTLSDVELSVVDKDDKTLDGVTFAPIAPTNLTSVKDGDKVKATFNKPGTYILKATVGGTEELKYTTTVTVKAEPVVLDKIDTVNAKVENGTADGTDANVSIPFKNGIGVLDLTEDAPNFAFDGVDTITITGVARDENGDTIQGKTIVATTNKDTVVEFDKDENNVVTAVTDNNGKFTISFKMPNKENATVTLVNEEANLSYTIQIWAVKSTAKDITRTLTDGYVLAGNDSKYGDEVYGNNAEVSFADAVAFKITDEQGEALTGQAAADGAKIDVRAVAKNSTLKDGDLKLIWDADAGVYTLAYTGKDATGTYVKDLIPGKYEVRVALPSEDGATVTFNVAKFGKVQDTVLAVTARDYDQSPANPNEEVMTVDDTITLGQQITVNAKYVDENGLKVPAKYVSFNFNGKAVSDWNKWNNVFATEPDIAANDSLIGTTVKVVAFNTANKQLVEKTLTVADSYTDKSLEFSSDNGAVSKDNKVNVSVVNEDGKVQQVEGYMTAWVADQSNEDAKISVDVNKNGAHDVQNGKGSLTVYADQETTADIVVVVKAGTEAYYGTLEYTFGSENAIANRTVVMTIDSTEYVVNNKIITGDAAPYIDSNWRTMVPIRALAESFDAEVIWNQDDSTVTINFDGDTQIVMTVGETAYTVDGAEATMDTEPVNAGDRVYVPVRFAAEGLGFSVLPLYNEAGLTASVVFQK